MNQQMGSLLSDNLAQGKPSAVFTNVGLLSQVLSDSNDPCTLVRCGSFGKCFRGACVCDAASGYSGTLCDVPPTPVDAVWGPWALSGTCSATCGTGAQLSTRVCASPPQFGGLPCTGDSIQTEPCNTQPCTVPPVPINGNYLAWSEWSCNAQCPGDVGGVFTGTETRSRHCVAPVNGGLPCQGEAQQSRKCLLE